METRVVLPVVRLSLAGNKILTASSFKERNTNLMCCKFPTDSETLCEILLI